MDKTTNIIHSMLQKSWLILRRMRGGFPSNLIPR